MQEFVSREYDRVFKPHVYDEWISRFLQQLLIAEANAANIVRLETLLEGNVLPEVFQFPPEPEKPEEGVVILQVPESEI